MSQTRVFYSLLGCVLAVIAIMLPGTSYANVAMGGGAAAVSSTYECSHGMVFEDDGANVSATGDTCEGDEDTASLRTSVKQVAGLISKQASGAFKSKRRNRNVALLGNTLTGLSAGGSGSNIGVWTNYDYLRADDHQANKDTTMNSFTIGGDMTLGSNLAIGLSAAYQIMDEEGAVDNTGSDVDSWTVAPYLAYMVSDYITVDMVLGYSSLDEDPDVGTSFQTDRLFLSANTTLYAIDTGDWDISANLGYLFTQDDVEGVDGGDSNDISFAQINTGMEFGYYMSDAVQPYVNVGYEEDLVYEANGLTYDPSGATIGTGIRLNFSSLSADVHASKMYSRKKFDQFAIMGNLRMSF